MGDQETLDTANAYAGAAVKGHTDSSDPHAFVDSTHGAGYAQIVDQNSVPLGKNRLAILIDGDPQPSTSTTAALFVSGSQKGVYVPGDGDVGWVNVGSSAAPVDTTPPTSPSALVVSNKTSSSFTLAWTGSTDVSGIARYETKIDGGQWISNGKTLSRDFAGLAAGDHQVQVRAIDGSAAANPSSPAQTTVTLVVTGGGGGTTKVSTIMGVNFDTQGSEYDGLWKALRVYRTGSVASAIATGATYIAFTDENGILATGGAASVAKFKTLFDQTWGGPGAPSKNKNVLMPVATLNEGDTDYANGMNFTQVADTMELLGALVEQYDNASLWFDFTRYHIGTGDAAKVMAFKSSSGRTIGSMLAQWGGMAGSYYPTGQDSKTYGYPTVLPQMYTVASDTPQTIVDPYITLAEQYGIKRMAMWEYGIPAGINPPPKYASPGSIYSDKNARPNWVKALIEYWMTSCLSHGMDPEASIYWDKQVPISGGGSGTGEVGNGNHDDRFTTDSFFSPKPSPTTAGVVFNAATNYNATH